MSQKYHVEFVKSVYMDYHVSADSKEEASEKALELLIDDINADEIENWDINFIDKMISQRI